ncbi:trypsin-like serine protease [Kutzneria kofuensis]|uniref:V8-like Glu-specific endopeptidase n=1 Tax=Kutzneria kofuensis TaxID=103725 RepID=A0A7W9KC78_9PSEU|nr:trypsin-like serine protease [Kutzneria kofuensis]MBB5889949.1 V8-like Glu-specific endopeptidase [Kutzneria kofuensis]
MSRIRWVAAIALTAALLPPVTAAAAGTPHTVVADPRPEIGSLSDGPDPTNHHCSASIVASPKGNIIVTAAHCVAGKSRVYFTPGYHDGQAPYGTWESAATYIDPGWATSHDIDGAGSPYDYAFVVLHPRNGRNVADVTGAALTLKTDATLPASMQVFGYPSTGNPNYKDKPYRCDSTVSRDGEYWETLQCTGIPGGFSGGPWIVGGRDLIGVIGGKGQNLPDTDPRNYSVRFDNRVKALYNKAVAAPVPPGNGNLGYPLGDGPLWKHADLITSGDFTGSRQLDMLVKWSDGEVTLYQGGSTTDPQQPFVGETQLAAPGGLWTHAKGIATVNNGVVVTWSDGEVTYYGTVGKNGFGNEVQLAAPNALWRDHASYIAGLGGDLVVVWSDGETTLYQGIAANGIHSERQLAAPNGTWTHAQTISGGNWVGAGTPDLLVRWSDGEFTVYGDVAAAGLGQEHQVEAPNELWTHATVTAGRGNAVLVRWSDGEVSLYPDVDGHLHREIQLVAP